MFRFTSLINFVIIWCIVIINGQNLVKTAPQTATAFPQKSCISQCYETSLPPCGGWLRYDNLEQVSGVYMLDYGYVNLTCVVHSLPQPLQVEWYAKPGVVASVPQSVIEFGYTTPREFKCTTMRTVIDCSHNDDGVHSVLSTCVLKITNLDQSGSYFCKAAQNVQSKPATIVVYGISNLTAATNNTALHYAKHGSIRVHVCGNPTPEVVWINDQTKAILRAGQTSGNYSAMPLQRVVLVTQNQEPAVVSRYCYHADLIISYVNTTEQSFTVIATTLTTQKSITIQSSILGLPVKSFATIKLGNPITLILCFGLFVLFSVWL